MAMVIFVSMAQTVGCTADTEGYDDEMAGEVALDEADEALSSEQSGDETSANVDDVDAPESRSGATARNWGWDDGLGNDRFRFDNDFFRRNPFDFDFCCFKFPFHHDFCHRRPFDFDDFFCCKFPFDRDFRRFPDNRFPPCFSRF
ncbi:hypothetical protein WMF30_12415 [Sorangium sp. So ce134]